MLHYSKSPFFVQKFRVELVNHYGHETALKRLVDKSNSIEI